MSKIILVGSSYMAEEHLKVLKHLKHDVLVVGRNKERAEALAQRYTCKGIGGGVDAIKDINSYDASIVACSVESLKDVTIALISKGMHRILVEKPGALNLKELQELRVAKSTDVRIAYNRRFYNSTLMLKKKIEDEGIEGLFFDFTEREKDIMLSKKSPEVLATWGYNNSTHVIDTAFFLTGLPEEIYCERQGSWKQHPTGTVFAGHGRTSSCIFSYFASWSGGGRWTVEISTSKGRYKLCPLEELHFMAKNQFGWEKLESPDKDDENFKPGVLKMDRAFLEKNENFILLPDVAGQVALCNAANSIFGYDK